MWTRSAFSFWRKAQSVPLGLAVKCSSKVRLSLTSSKAKLKALLDKLMKQSKQSRDCGIGPKTYGHHLLADLRKVDKNPPLLLLSLPLYLHLIKPVQTPIFSRCRLCMKSVSNWVVSLTFSKRFSRTTKT